MENIEFYHIYSCKQCGKSFALPHLTDHDDYYSKYEDEYCHPCRQSLLVTNGIKKYSFLMGSKIVGYTLEDISTNPELRNIEVQLTDGRSIKIKVKDTRWLSSNLPPLCQLNGMFHE
uniref:C2H2-type domain-containing protein n=1 Tax=viral metagenome TaxID=1070528 RepID=A0A6M3KY87_9ZZZZ